MKKLLLITVFFATTQAEAMFSRARGAVAKYAHLTMRQIKNIKTTTPMPDDENCKAAFWGGWTLILAIHAFLEEGESPVIILHDSPVEPKPLVVRPSQQ